MTSPRSQDGSEQEINDAQSNITTTLRGSLLRPITPDDLTPPLLTSMPSPPVGSVPPAEYETSYMARARALLNRAPSPFYQAMVQTAERISQGPSLDLTGGLEVGVPDRRSQDDTIMSMEETTNEDLPGNLEDWQLRRGRSDSVTTAIQDVDQNDTEMNTAQSESQRHRNTAQPASRSPQVVNVTESDQDRNSRLANLREMNASNQERRRALLRSMHDLVNTSNMLRDASDRILDNTEATQERPARFTSLRTAASASRRRENAYRSNIDQTGQIGTSTRRELDQALEDYRRARRTMTSRVGSESANGDRSDTRQDPVLSHLQQLQQDVSETEVYTYQGGVLVSGPETSSSSIEAGTALRSSPTFSRSTAIPPSLPSTAAMRAARQAWERIGIRHNATINEQNINAAPNDNNMIPQDPANPHAGIPDSLLPFPARQRQLQEWSSGTDANSTSSSTNRPQSYNALRMHLNMRASAIDETGTASTTNGSLRDRRAAVNQPTRQRNKDKQSGRDTFSRNMAKMNLKYLTQLAKCRTADKSEVDQIVKTLRTDLQLDRMNGGHRLPCSINEMPQPELSSWLNSGMCWNGEQSSGIQINEDHRSSNWASGPLFRGARIANSNMEDITERMLSLRASRHRERVRLERYENERRLLMLAEHRAVLDRRLVLDGTSAQSLEFNNRLQALVDSHETLADVERHLSDLLEEEEQRLNNDTGWRGRGSLLGRPRNQQSQPDKPPLIEDKWPVNVDIHEVDWVSMTLKGTMKASQIPDRSGYNFRASDVPNSATDQTMQTDLSNMESYFTGEIIDFRNHELETVENKPGYSVGGLDVDLRYWGGLPPFTNEIERMKVAKKKTKALEKNARMQNSGATDTKAGESDSGGNTSSPNTMDLSDACSGYENIVLTKEEEEEASDLGMVKCLGDKNWLQKAFGSEWILMRWKERSFVSSSSALAASNTSDRYSSSSTQLPHYGLTISGFYYVSLHRQTGRIEALYYDPGSSPFQRLVMWPESFKMDANNEKDVIGVRKWFPAIELR